MRRPNEEWRGLQVGDEVEVVDPISHTERSLLGRRFTIKRFVKPHGYVVVADEWGSWHVHPESLARTADRNPDDPGEDIDPDWNKVALVALVGIGVWLLMRGR